MRPRVIALLAALLIGGCGVELPRTYSVDPRFTDDETALIGGAVAAWSDATAGYFSLLPGRDADVKIWRDADDADYNGLMFRSGWVRTRWTIFIRPQQPCSFQRTAAHELGHVILFRGHLDEGLMALDAGAATWIDEPVVETFRRKHGSCAECRPVPLPACL